jgi:photosystem II stability/assembly factor-like uncharacterized protein
MKLFFILIAAMLTFQVTIAQNWIKQNSGSDSYNLLSVAFINGNLGYVAGYDLGNSTCLILKTTNGGMNWIKDTLATTNYFKSICFGDSSTVYAFGSVGVIIKSTNPGGWSFQNSGSLHQLSSACFLDKNNGYAVGESGTIIKTKNGGALWTHQTSGISTTLNSVYFTDTNAGIAVGQPEILKTSDGGVTWESRTSGNTQALGSVYFTDTNTGYIVGQDGLILKTTNGGNSWLSQTSGTTVPLRSVFFPNSTTGYIVGEAGTILKTANGGTLWKKLTSGTNIWLNSVYFIDAYTGYVVGADGTILKTTNGGETGLNENSTQSKHITVYPNPTKNRFNFESSIITMATYFSINTVNGVELMKGQITSQNTQVDISDLPSGLYFIRIKNEKAVEVGIIIKD